MSNEKMEEIEIDKIDMIENIRIAEDSKLHELMDSIKQHGLQQPIGVYKINGRYLMKYGFRRITAHKKLGYNTILAKVDYEYKEAEDKIENLILNSIENLQREDITPIELGRICSRLKDMGLNITEISIRLSKPKARIEKAIRLYEQTPEEFRKFIKFKSGNLKNPYISSTSANLVSRLAQRGLINTDEFKFLLESIKKKELKLMDITFIISLIEHGLPVKEAVKNWSKYDKVRLNFVVYKKELLEAMKKHGLKKTDLARKMLLGEIPKTIKFIVFKG